MPLTNEKAASYPDLKSWRAALHLSQTNAAARLGISAAHYSKIENQVQTPSARLAYAIHTATDVPYESLLGLS